MSFNLHIQGCQNSFKFPNNNSLFLHFHILFPPFLLFCKRCSSHLLSYPLYKKGGSFSKSRQAFFCCQSILTAKNAVVFGRHCRSRLFWNAMTISFSSSVSIENEVSAMSSGTAIPGVAAAMAPAMAACVSASPPSEMALRTVCS